MGNGQLFYLSVVGKTLIELHWSSIKKLTFNNFSRESL